MKGAAPSGGRGHGSELSRGVTWFMCHVVGGQLLTFMSELQASGLLKDDVSETDEDSQGNAPREDSAAHAAMNASDADGAETAVLRSEEAEVGEEASSAAAEQRVLGDLEGCPGWSEVGDPLSLYVQAKGA